MITVFTPAYNRANLLGRLYQSLKIQTDKNFEWLIVDDGSTDGTEAVVRGFQEEKEIPIRYFFQKNQGKHIAINLGAELAQGEWFFIVDSDDYLTETAIGELNACIAGIEDDPGFAGVAGLKGKPDGSAWDNWYGRDDAGVTEQEQPLDATSLEYRYRYKVRGDRAEVIRTELVRRYPFPKFDGENFMSEAVLWFRVADAGYRFRWFHSVVYIAEYLEDGLSRNMKEIQKRNWRGAGYCDNLCLSLHGIPLMEQVRNCIHYYRMGMCGGVPIRTLFRQCNNKWLGSFCWVGALLLKFKE